MQELPKDSKPKRSKIERRTRTSKKRPKTVNLTETPKETIVEEVSGESSSDEESVSDESSVLSSIDEWQMRVQREKEQKERFEDIRLAQLRRHTAFYNAGKDLTQPR